MRQTHYLRQVEYLITTIAVGEIVLLVTCSQPSTLALSLNYLEIFSLVQCGGPKAGGLPNERHEAMTVPLAAASANP